MQRNTAQRSAIRKAFTDTPRPLTPQEVHDISKETLPSLGMATIYRTLKSLVEEEWIIALEVPGEAPRYERAGMDHHHHFSCRGCGKMFDFQGCPAGITSLVPEGFHLEDHELFLYGTCPDCNPGAPAGVS